MVDPENSLGWRAQRKRLEFEQLRDSMLQVSGSLEPGQRSRAAPLLGDGSEPYSKRRSIYGYINRFNLDPTLRVFDFANPMQSQGTRVESIVAPQALFTMNSPFVIDQAIALTEQPLFGEAKSDEQRAAALFQLTLQREPHQLETARVLRFIELQQRFFPDPKRKRPSRIQTPRPLVAQSQLMSNEFQYVD